MTECNGKRIIRMLPRGRQSSSVLRYLAEHEVRAINSTLIASRRRGLKQLVKGALRGAEVACESVQIPIPIERLQIFAVKFQRLGVGLPRTLWIAQARDGTEVAIRCGCGFAVLLKS